MSTISINKGDWVGTKAQYIALDSISANKKYYVTDLETFVITNSAMASALTTYADLYNNGDVFLCIDSGTYAQNAFYKLDNGSWVELGRLAVNYVHEQAVASATWTITHNLNKYPSVTVVDSSGDVVYCNIHYVDRNTITLSFTAEFGGFAYLN